MKHLFFFSFILLLNFTPTTLAQSSPSPTPSGPLNITAVLEKAGQFGTLIRLLKSTQVSDRINAQLNNSNQGLTLFAPTDNAFSTLKPGTLNSLSDQQKVSLVQFHVIPTFLSVSNFQTVSDPVLTQAGNGNGRYPLNVTTTGNSVNITTGIVNTTVGGTIYTDGQLAVYQVDSVLLPIDIFGPPAPAAAPAPAKAKKKSGSSTVSESPDSGKSDASGGVGLVNRRGVVVAGFLVAVIGFL
ncbi:fasciclin-like arabinogalactan protein 11 [Tasmannia lanceolata]|uniref:fasciclin-like arabinogalactan protein 11 n=1 Tax=Tasmannia lanceolata TaxID=3420 RepID=UPI004062B2AC